MFVPPPQDAQTGQLVSAHALHKMSDITFGFIPNFLIEQLTDKDWKVRSNAIEKVSSAQVQTTTRIPSLQLQITVEQLSNVQPVLPHVPKLLRFLTQLVHDSNFKITLTAIQIIDHLLIKVRSKIEACVPQFLPELVEVHTLNLLTSMRPIAPRYSLLTHTSGACTCSKFVETW